MSDHSHQEGHGSFNSYMIGFFLSVVLTVPPFWLVLGEVNIDPVLAVFIIFGLGAIQMVVHIYYFLHVTIKAEDGWQAMALGLTILLVVIVLSGSIWVMFHLHENMMPDHEVIERVRQLP